MSSRRRLALIAGALVAGAGAVAARVSDARAVASPAPTAALAFMAGCWEQRTGARLVEEHWLAPRAGGLLGMARTTRNDTLLEFEFTRIVARGDTLVFIAQPSGRPPTEFRASSVREGAVTFENLANDFPHRVTYRAAGSAGSADSLIARIEGTHAGRVHGIDFPFARVACPGGAR